MVRGEVRWIMLVIILPTLILQTSSGRMGYDIIAQVSGSFFELNRTTTNENFAIDGSVSGTGNFSRLTHIDGFAGIKDDERTSCVKKSKLNYSEQLRLLSWEGPVVVTVNLQSNNITNQSQSIFILKEFANIGVDEHWPTYFANLKRISYFGPGIRTGERYENNGDVVASHIDSWNLSKTSLYRATYNRTFINVSLTPSGVFLDRSQNKTSSYLLGVQSTGSLTHLDVTQRGSSNEIVNKISQDYKGQQKMNLKVDMNSYILMQPTEDIEWLPCCSIDLTGEKFQGNQSLYWINI